MNDLAINGVFKLNLRDILDISWLRWENEFFTLISFGQINFLICFDYENIGINKISFVS